MSDESHSSLFRATSMRNRPNHAPMGPRVRNRTSTSGLDGIASPARSISPAPPSSPAPTSTSSTRPNSKSLAAISESEPQPQEPQPAPPYLETPENLPSSHHATNPPSRAMPKPPIQLPKLVPPPTIRFESIPVPWKSLPLEAALWTFSSEELQVIVSRAIRSSSSESFIRLLSLENLDKVLPKELKRLEALKGVTQAKYRFLVQRRTMLTQALNSSSGGHTGGEDDGYPVNSRLTVQLSETTAECDQLVEELMNIADQTAQICKLVDNHWASALAIALRKLNTSYGRRTSDLTQANERVTQLEAELEDAWAQAEKLAKEMDDIDNFMYEDEDEVVIEKAEIVSVNQRAASPRPPSVISAQLLNVAPYSPTQFTPTLPSSPHRETAPADVPDTVSLHSNHSYRSTRSGHDSRISGVSAARKRSFRASQNSLRLPARRGLTRSKTIEEHPPVPDLPEQFISIPQLPNINKDKTTLRRFKTANASLELLAKQIVRKQASLDSFLTSGNIPLVFRIEGTRDDISLRPSQISDNTQTQEISKTAPLPPPVRRPTIVERSPTTAQPSKHIPSIWVQSDGRKPVPSERVQAIVGPNAKASPYNKLMTLTKRYSLPFAMFAAKTNVKNKSSTAQVRSFS